MQTTVRQKLLCANCWCKVRPNDTKCKTCGSVLDPSDKPMEVDND